LNNKIKKKKNQNSDFLVPKARGATISPNLKYLLGRSEHQMPRSTEPRLTDDNLEELLGGGNSPTNQFKLYNLRFLILAIFTFSTLSNASLWTTLAPISTDASKYFFDEDGSRKQTINLCSLMYQICYLPGTIVASILTERGGLRSTVLVGSMLTAFGASIRYFSVFFLGGTPTSYVIVVVGQSFAAFGQPMFVNSPGLLAANWFGANERDAATTVASLGAIIGNAVGQLVPPALVSSDEANHVNGMENLMLIQAGIAFAICLLVHFGFYSNPITPPSQSTTDRDIHNNQAKKNRRISRHSEKEKDEMVSFTNNGGGDDKSVLDSLDLLYNSARDLMGNRDYVILLGAFGVGLALFNGLLTVINNFLEPCGYSEDEAGNYAAALIAAGLLGAIVCGVLMEIYHVYRSLLKVLYLCGTLATLFLIFQVDTNNYNNLLLR